MERCNIREFVSIDALFLASIVKSEVGSKKYSESAKKERLFLGSKSTYRKMELQVSSPVTDDKFASHWKTVAELSETFTGTNRCVQH